MRPSILALLMFLCGGGCAGSIWSRKTHEDHAMKNLDVDESESIDFDLTLLRPQKAPDSAIITKALKAIEDLNRKQFCHRFAASMLLDNCRTPEQAHISAVTTNVVEQERREEYLKVFAVSLTMCDIEALQRPLPPQCAPYGQSALMHAKNHGGSRSLRINHAEMNGCLKAIGSDQSAVVSWKFNQQSAAVVCQVARMDIEKDETIALFATLTRLMAEVVEEVQKLSEVNRDIHREAKEAKELVSAVRASVDKFKAGLSGVWNGISAEATKARDNVKDIFSSMSTYASEVDQLLGKLRQDALENHAQQAVVQQRAFDITTDIASSAQNANQDMEVLRNLMLTIYKDMNSMGNGLVAIQDRQNKMDRQSAQVLSAMTNMTEQLQLAATMSDEHAVILGKATEAASALSGIIDRTTSVASTWQSRMFGPSGPFGVNWSLFIGTPVMVLLLGSYGLEPSFKRNAMLVISGLLLSKLIAIGCDEQQSWTGERSWTDESDLPLQSFANSAEEHLESIVTQAVPVNL